MDIFKYLINRKVILHSIFWFLLLISVFFAESWEKGVNMQMQMFVQFFFAFLVFAFVCYYNMYRLIPRYFKTKRYWLYGIFLFLILILGALLTTFIKDLTLKLGLGLADGWKHIKHNDYYFFHMLTGELMLVMLTTFFYILEEWIRLQSITIQLQENEGEKTRSELQALKAQINPHFLFNTLNNIYSHSLTQSPKAPEMILKLSSLMSYILYDCTGEKVPVANEIQFIQDYIELEKNRFEDNIEVELTIEDSCSGCHIAPLLLIPFIENAFKHSSANKLRKKFIHVFIHIDGNNILLNIINSVDRHMEPSQAIKNSGIGIENVRKRLELIYPGRSELIIERGEDEFKVTMKITENGN